MPNRTATFPAIALLSVLLTYGGLLAIITCSVADNWSGQASLISFYLVFVAPVVMAVVGYRSRQARRTSAPHKWVYYAGFGYFIILPAALSLLILYDSFKQSEAERVILSKPLVK